MLWVVSECPLLFESKDFPMKPPVPITITEWMCYNLSNLTWNSEMTKQYFYSQHPFLIPHKCYIYFDDCWLLSTCLQPIIHNLAFSLNFCVYLTQNSGLSKPPGTERKDWCSSWYTLPLECPRAEWSMKSVGERQSVRDTASGSSSSHRDSTWVRVSAR